MIIRKKWLIIFLILVVFVILNPSMNRFKEYTGLIGKESSYVRRTYNFLIFSIYEDKYNDKKYVGVLMNFINISPKPQVLADTTSSVTTDTTAIISTDTTAHLEKKDTKPAKFVITNIMATTNDKLEDFVSFTFQNTSGGKITNIMFEESYFPVKKLKSNFSNKKVNLNPKDSVKFIFKRNYDRLTVYKIRFASGDFITYGNDFFNYDNIIYDKLGENKVD